VEAEAHSRGDDRPQSRTEGGHHQKWVERNPERRTELEGIEWHSRGWVERNPEKDQSSRESRLRKEFGSIIENIKTQKIRIRAENSLKFQMISTSKIENKCEQGVAQKRKYRK
jgi:hypothetical protein